MALRLRHPGRRIAGRDRRSAPGRCRPASRDARALRRVGRAGRIPAAVRHGGRALLAAAFLFLATPASSADARDAATRLAILAEHLGKVHAQVVHGVGAERGRRALAQAMRDFDHGLRAAASQAPASMQDHYALLTLLWREHRAWLAKPAVRDPARAEAERDEELTYLTLKGARLAGPLAGLAGEAARAARL